jgi:hypothetical protein
MDTEPVTMQPESPTIGATGVPVKPVFQWTAVIGAEAYELVVATDAAMADPAIARTDENAIAGNAWQCDVSLDYATTYYWKVRAINATTRSPWSTIGVFTTGDAPLSPETPPATTAPDHEIVGRPANLDTVPLTPNPTPAPMEPAPAVNVTVIPNPSVLPGIPNWVFYLISGLLAAVILTLIVVLMIVIKIKRAT